MVSVRCRLLSKSRESRVADTKYQQDTQRYECRNRIVPKVLLGPPIRLFCDQNAEIPSSWLLRRSPILAKYLCIVLWQTLCFRANFVIDRPFLYSAATNSNRRSRRRCPARLRSSTARLNSIAASISRCLTMANGLIRSKNFKMWAAPLIRRSQVSRCLMCFDFRNLRSARIPRWLKNLWIEPSTCVSRTACAMVICH